MIASSNPRIRTIVPRPKIADLRIAEHCLGAVVV
jgi:hypothetical protein